MSETVEQIVAEMHRNPDAQYLLGWILGRISPVDDPAVNDVRTAVIAYFDAIEEL